MNQFKFLLAAAICFGFLSGCTALHQADLEMRNHNYEQAARLYAEYLEQNPNSIATEIKLGISYYKSGRIDKAVPRLLSALEKSPFEPRATLYLALSHLKTDQSTQALSLFADYRHTRKPFVEDEMARQAMLLKEKINSGKPKTTLDQATLDQIEATVMDAIRFQEQEDEMEDIGGGGGGCGC